MPRYVQLAGELVGMILLGVAIVGPLDYLARTALLGDQREWIDSLVFGGLLGTFTWIRDRVRSWRAARHDVNASKSGA